jgi:hypothetical protein
MKLCGKHFKIVPPETTRARDAVDVRKAVFKLVYAFGAIPMLFRSFRRQIGSKLSHPEPSPSSPIVLWVDKEPITKTCFVRARGITVLFFKV